MTLAVGRTRRQGDEGWSKAAAGGCHVIVIVAFHVAASLHKHDLTLAGILCLPAIPFVLFTFATCLCISEGECIIYAYACQMSHMARISGPCRRVGALGDPGTWRLGSSCHSVAYGLSSVPCSLLLPNFWPQNFCQPKCQKMPAGKCN